MGRCGYAEYSVLRQQRRVYSVAAAFKAAMGRSVYARYCALRCDGSYTQCPWRQIAAATKRRDVCTSGRIFSRIRIAPWRRRRRRYGEGEIAGFLWDYSFCTRCHGRCGYAENGVILQQRRVYSVAAATCRHGAMRIRGIQRFTAAKTRLLRSGGLQGRHGAERIRKVLRIALRRFVYAMPMAADCRRYKKARCLYIGTDFLSYTHRPMAA